jgi:vancomycin resistance protein YoaR
VPLQFALLRADATVSTYQVRRRRAARARRLRRLGALGLVVLAAVLGFGFAYQGSTDHLAAGVRIDGVDVGGLSDADAQKVLQRRFARVARRPLVLHAGTRRFTITAGRLGVLPDWKSAIADARAHTSGVAVLRGYRRLYVRVFGVDVDAPTGAYRPALDELLDRIARAVDVPRRDAALVLRGLQPVVVPSRTGTILDRPRAASLIVSGLGSLEREPVELPLKRDVPQVTAARLQAAAAKARVAVSAPVRLTLGPTYYRLPRWRIAKMLALPAGGSTKLELGGPEADHFFARLGKVVGRPARDADFAVDGSQVNVIPSVDARVLDARATAENVLAAALSRARRTAAIVVVSKPAKLTTKEAQAMGITSAVATYTTVYGGVANRIHNVQLVARLIDDHLIAPGAEFSFNATTGERSAEKGFLEAPVIINGELETGLGGGVCQVSTTVFNAAYEAGLKITARTNHALYISHYPQGRDATVNYPDTDLKFVNDTGHWLLLRTFVGSSSLTVGLYGTPVHRKVVSETSPLLTTGGPPVKLVKDPELEKGKRVIEEQGSPSLSTSVHRRVYDADGKLLYDNVWYSSYRGETRVVHVGTKPKPKPVTAPVLLPGTGPVLLPQ